MSETLRFQGRALKAEQCSPDEARDMREHRLAGDPRSEGRATDAEKHRAGILIHALALKSRVNPEIAASSVVDLECIRRCDRARRDPTTCTP